jgi:hypothetical protein
MNNRLTRYEFDYRDPKETIWQEKMKQRHVWSESLRRLHDADRETTRGVLQVAWYTSRCSCDEGCNSRSRQHRLWLQHHHRGAGRPLCARRLGATAETQFGYSPSSVSSLTSTSVANSFSEITPAWVQGLKDATGSMPFAEGGSTNIGLLPVNINPTREDLIQAYPWKAALVRQLPENYNIRTLLRSIL